MSASESSTLQPNTPIPTTSPDITKIPLLGESFQAPKPKSVENSDVESELEETTGNGTKPEKRRLFGFGKKKKKAENNMNKTKSKEDTLIPTVLAGNADSVAERAPPQTSPTRSNHPYGLPASPKRNLFSSSPRAVSPAGSQIFERDVQEGTLPVPNSPAIPSHIQRENHIPPVLDASSEAITNDSIDPDTVEIVMHSSHQPAAVTVTGIGSSEVKGENWADDLVAHPDKDDAASNYGALDSTDIHRLSFISFQDIVQSEHMEHVGGRDSIYAAGLSTMSSEHRSPSPMRSPISSPGLASSPGLGSTPPTSNPTSIKGGEISPRAKMLGSPVPPSHSSGGELTIESLSQALRRTGSGDFSGIRSQPLSPISPDGLSEGSMH